MVRPSPILFGLSVATILNDVSLTVLPRDLNVVELWSGVFAVGTAAMSAGFKARPFDIDRLPGVTDVQEGPLCENILLRDGFLRAVRLVLRLAPGGLLVLAPVCSSMGFANSSRCRRSHSNPRGDTTYQSVRNGNAMALTCEFLLTLACQRGVRVVIENPPNSWLWVLLVASLIALHTDESTVHRCTSDDSEPGLKYWKPYKFLAVSAESQGAA